MLIHVDVNKKTYRYLFVSVVRFALPNCGRVPKDVCENRHPQMLIEFNPSSRISSHSSATGLSHSSATGLSHSSATGLSETSAGIFPQYRHIRGSFYKSHFCVCCKWHFYYVKASWEPTVLGRHLGSLFGIRFVGCPHACILGGPTEVLLRSYCNTLTYNCSPKLSVLLPTSYLLAPIYVAGPTGLPGQSGNLCDWPNLFTRPVWVSGA